MTEARRRSAQRTPQFEMPSPFKGLPRTGLPTTTTIAEVPSPSPDAAASRMTEGQMGLVAAGSRNMIEQARAGFADGALDRPSLRIIRQALLDALEHIDAELAGKPTPFTPSPPPKRRTPHSDPDWLTYPVDSSGIDAGS